MTDNIRKEIDEILSKAIDDYELESKDVADIYDEARTKIEALLVDELSNTYEYWLSNGGAKVGKYLQDRAAFIAQLTTPKDKEGESR